MIVEAIKGGEPSVQEMAAIMAAIEQAWPKSISVDPRSVTPKWRFSGRDWPVRNGWSRNA